jgi:hypothetical protein
MKFCLPGLPRRPRQRGRLPGGKRKGSLPRFQHSEEHMRDNIRSHLNSLQNYQSRLRWAVFSVSAKLLMHLEYNRILNEKTNIKQWKSLQNY